MSEAELQNLEPGTETKSIEQVLRDKVQMLTQLLILGGLLVALQFVIMIKVIYDHPQLPS